MPRLIRWILLLQKFDIEIKDKAGAKNVLANHLYQLVLLIYDLPIDYTFPYEHFLAVVLSKTPRFADIANYLAYGVLPSNLTYHQNKKFFDLKSYL